MEDVVWMRGIVGGRGASGMTLAHPAHWPANPLQRRLSHGPECRGADDIGASSRSLERDLDLRRGLRCSVAPACTPAPSETLALHARAWRTAARPLALALALALLPGAGTAAAQGTLPTVSVSDVGTFNEDVTWVMFKVSLSAASDEQVTVDYATSSGTATSGTDFRAESGTLIFPPNDKVESVIVLVYDDSEIEPDETFTLTLTNPTRATLGDATATATIRNDDTAATLTASNVGETTATLTISGHTQGWWYKGNVHQCTAVPAGTATANISGLTAATPYEYKAYSDSTCATSPGRREVPDPCARGHADSERVGCPGERGRHVDEVQGVAVGAEP